jgi:hypothetical protein
MENQANSQSDADSKAPDTISYTRDEYENICKTVGNLYISLMNVRKEAETQYGTTINALGAQVQQLLQVNKELQEKTANPDSCCKEEDKSKDRDAVS